MLGLEMNANAATIEKMCDTILCRGYILKSKQKKRNMKDIKIVIKKVFRKGPHGKSMYSFSVNPLQLSLENKSPFL